MAWRDQCSRLHRRWPARSSRSGPRSWPPLQVENYGIFRSISRTGRGNLCAKMPTKSKGESGSHLREGRCPAHQRQHQRQPCRHGPHTHHTYIAPFSPRDSSPPPFLNTSSLPAPAIKCPWGLLIPSPSALALCSTLLLVLSFTLSPRYSSFSSCNKTAAGKRKTLSCRPLKGPGAPAASQLQSVKKQSERQLQDTCVYTSGPPSPSPQTLVSDANGR